MKHKEIVNTLAYCLRTYKYLNIDVMETANLY